MLKWIVGLLLLANLALFGWMKWGSALTEDAQAGAVQAALNPDKIKLLESLPAPSAIPASGAAPAPTLPAPASAPVAGAPLPVPASTPTPAVTAASGTPNCAEWGEFSGADLARAQQALAELKLGDRLTQRLLEQDHGYWVYIPPLKSRAAVEKKISQLKERGVVDYFVVQEKGRWLNAISLGVFKTEEAAQKYLATLKTMKVRSATMGERKSKLKFTVFAMKGLDAGLLERLNVMQKGFPDSQLKVMACSN
ncbi:MAG: SPOR domain-containing protein [Sideroxyarcus sp.]|nr:SPOR domain-containing protein [Sideroxyarcus sp.]